MSNAASRIVIHGAAGRMGRAVRECIEADPAMVVSAALDAHPAEGQLLPADWDGSGDVVVDFSLPEGVRALAPLCRQHRVALVSGTTGLTAADESMLDELAVVVPVLTASNFSIGLSLVVRALRDLAARLPPGYDCEIVERHHSAKIDAPSGTALTLARAVADARGRELDEVACWGRKGQVGPRPADEIAIHSIRQGDIVGAHEVSFATNGESVTVSHEARSRAVFAAGAVLAAGFLVSATPGRYRFGDVLCP